MSFYNGVVKIIADANGVETVGTGFINSISNKQIITCLHNLANSTAGTFKIDFNGTVFFASLSVAKPSQDVAVLEWNGIAPKGLIELPLRSLTTTGGSQIQSFGFAQNTSFKGVGAIGKFISEVVDALGNRKVQLESDQITSGFSGAPIWSSADQCVIGMIQQVQTRDSLGQSSGIFGLHASAFMENSGNGPTPRIVSKFRLDRKGIPSAFRSRDGTMNYRVTISLEGFPPDTYEVTYYLDESFGDEGIFTKRSFTSNFAEEIETYGEIDLIALVRLRSQIEPLVLHTRLSKALADAHLKEATASAQVADAIEYIRCDGNKRRMKKTAQKTL